MIRRARPSPSRSASALASAGGPQAWLWIGICIVWVWLSDQGMASAADPPPHASEIRVDAVEVRLKVIRGGGRVSDGSSVARRSARVEAIARYRLERPARSGDVLVLLDFAAFMREEPVELDEVALATYLEGPFEPGSTTITGAWGVHGVRREGPRRDVVVVPEVGSRWVTLRYVVAVPHRYWPFGCVDRRCSLSGAIAPLPSVPADGGRWLPPGRVVDPVRWTVEHADFAVPGRHHADARADAQGRAKVRRTPEELVVVGGRGESTPYPSVFWGPRWHRTVEDFHGVQIEVLHPWPRFGNEYPRETALQWFRDVPGRVMHTAKDGIEILEATAQLPGPVMPRLVAVQGPLRSTVAEAHPGVVLVSDQAFELLPAKRFLKFHEEALARSVLDVLVEAWFRGRHSPSVETWASGMMSFALLGAWREAQAHRDEYAPDLLRNFTFMPAVDRFLYTQQAAFSQTYFRGVEDDPPLRNHPLWFSHQLPTGRRLHAKLTDTFTPEQLEHFYRAMFERPDLDPERTAELAYGRTLGWFFEQWLGPYPSVDYAIAGVESEEVEEDRWRHVIEVRVDGDRPVIEPVQVLVTERGGEQHYLVWNGQLDSNADALEEEPSEGVHRFELVTSRPIANVRLDPRKRLVQTAQEPRENVDPRFNDRTPPEFRFLYTGAGVSFAASEFFNSTTPAARFNAITGFAAFEGSLRRDLRRTGNVIIARDRETHVSVGAGANFWLGDKINPQRRRSRVRLFVTTAWLNDLSLDPRGGVRVSESLAFIDDTRRFAWWPERGHFISVSVTPRQTVRVDEGPNDHRYDLALGAEWTQLWNLAHDHVLASQLRGDLVIPLRGDPEFRSLTRVGGIGGLSGYGADEVFGLAKLAANLEYRHVYVNDLRGLHGLHLAWLRSLGGVVFTGAATVSQCQSYDGWFGKDSWYGQVGYGLQAYTQILGVTPQLFRLDIAVPLVRREGRTCLGETFPDYLGEVQGLEDAEVLLPPFSVNILFNQAF